MTTSSRASVFFRERLVEGLQQLAIEVDQAGIDRLAVYFQELKKWSAKVNLIARNSGDEQIVENHFLDSLVLLPLLQEPHIHLLDVGTGAGFPGLVLQAARPDMRLTLVEPRRKRVSFLRHVIRTLRLEGVTVLECRIEEEQQLPSTADFTHITSRAVTDVAGFLAMTARFTSPALQVICMKGPKWQEELAAAADLVNSLGYLQPEVVSKFLPFSGAERTLLVFSRGLQCCGQGKNVA